LVIDVFGLRIYAFPGDKVMPLRFKRLVGELSIEDKILIFRTIIGVVIGILCFIIDLCFIPLTNSLTSSIYAWIIVLLAYLATVPLVYIIFKARSYWLLFGKGVLMYFLAWFISWITIYDTYAYFTLTNITSTNVTTTTPP